MHTACHLATSLRAGRSLHVKIAREELSGDALFSFLA